MKEACGVFAIFDNDNLGAARMAYTGLFALQHRGQESCGIAVNNGGVLTLHKDTGLVSEVFHDRELSALKGNIAIGHVRYSTAGGTGVLNAQPIMSYYMEGQLAMAHNGNLSNAEQLRLKMEKLGTMFQTRTDSEIIMHMLAHARQKTGSIEEALLHIFDEIEGAFSIVMLGKRKLIACRDAFGMRPLCLGKIGGSYLIASESCALDTVGAEFIRDIEPGEIVVIDENGWRSIRDKCQKEHKICVFEYLYFARSDSVIDGMGVHEARKNAGRILWEEYMVPADLVIGVPDSGIDGAIGYAQAAHIPYGKGIVINGYVGRTFIQPTQTQRLSAVNLKINVLKDAVRGKRVIMVDDSIVRGTTSARLVKMVRDAGATEVHMRIAAPPFLHPCYFGTDVPDRKELIACTHTLEEIREQIGADSLGYLPLERLHECVPELSGRFCDGCFSGLYPYPVDGAAPCCKGQ